MIDVRLYIILYFLRNHDMEVDVASYRFGVDSLFITVEDGTVCANTSLGHDIKTIRYSRKVQSGLLGLASRSLRDVKTLAYR